MYLYEYHPKTEKKVTPITGSDACFLSSSGLSTQMNETAGGDPPPNPPHSPQNIRHSLVKRTQQFAQASLELASEVTKRKQMEVTLTATEEKYRLMFENAIKGIFQITPEGRLISANPALARLYGYATVESLMIELTNIRDLYSDRHRHSQLVEWIAEKGSVQGFESQICRPDGQLIWISETARAVRDEQGTFLYYEGMVEDISDRKQAELSLKASEASYKQQAESLQQAFAQLQLTQGQLIQQEKMSSLGQLIAGVAHEINNPVSFVCGNLNHAIAYTQDLLHLVSLYQTHYPQPVAEIQDVAAEIDIEFLAQDLPQVLGSMEVGANRIRQLVASLRHFSRGDHQNPEPVNLHEGLDSTLMILHNRLKARGNHPEIKIDKHYGTIPEILGYGGQLNQVFMNLLSNAIDAIEETLALPNPPTEAPAINITTTQLNSETVEIRISDNGMGMTPEVYSRLFETFFTTKPVGKGTGLGLSISRQIIVAKHRGELRCESTFGKGTTFIIQLPIAPPPTPPRRGESGMRVTSCESIDQ